MGVWAPLAMAQIYQVLMFIATAFMKDGGKVPTTAEVLQSFALPAMAEAMRREEGERKARDIISDLRSMAERTGGKFEIKTVEK